MKISWKFSSRTVTVYTVLLIIIICIGSIIWSLEKNSIDQITNYQECVDAGGGVILTFEGICTHPDKPGIEYRGSSPNTELPIVTNFDQCAAAGYAIMESYPEQCMTDDGRSFTRELSEEEKKKLIPPNQ